MSSPSDHASDRPGLRPGGPESLVGVVLSGRYRIERLIGEGGMGAVYQAEHAHMHKRLAVKVLHPEMSRLPEVVARFEREAMAAAHIEHPNVAAATDFGKLDDGSFFLVLEYVEGRSLREAISAGPLELGRACHVTRQIASALARAHALGIVHRDLKPENVMLVTRDDDADFVKVLDFGIAKVPIGAFAGESHAPGQVLTQLGMVYGTPEYMAPEQALGQDVDARADLYALGAMLFEMITGTRPYNHESKVTLLGMHVTAPIPLMGERAPVANVPPEVDAIVTRLLAKEATARFGDSRELIDALDSTTSRLAAVGRIPDPAAAHSRKSPGPNSGGAGPRESATGAAMALGPTSLAQPGPARPGTDPGLRSAQPLVTLVAAVERAVSRALKSAPPWVTPRLVVLAASGVAALLAVVLLAGPSSRSSPMPGASAATRVAPPPRPPDPKTDDVVAAASAKIDKGDFASATDTLSALEKAGPDRADVHALLEHAYTSVHNTREAMREAGLWLTADPDASADARLQEDTRNAALFRDAQDEAFALLEAKMGARGVDLLFDIAYGASGRQFSQASSRARHSLDMDDVRGRASPALAVLLDFREAKTCDAKRALLDRARTYGDARMASTLQPYLGTRGCGFLGHADCYPCLHKDGALKDAISAISER